MASMNFSLWWEKQDVGSPKATLNLISYALSALIFSAVFFSHTFAISPISSHLVGAAHLSSSMKLMPLVLCRTA